MTWGERWDILLGKKSPFSCCFPSSMRSGPCLPCCPHHGPSATGQRLRLQDGMGVVARRAGYGWRKDRWGQGAPQRWGEPSKRWAVVGRKNTFLNISNWKKTQYIFVMPMKPLRVYIWILDSRSLLLDSQFLNAITEFFKTTINYSVTLQEIIGR